MLNFLYELLPVLLFFIIFKWYGIYAATIAGIVISAIQFSISSLWLRKIDNKQLITLGVFLIFGGLTLYFHNPIFVKWKPTIVFWIFGVVLLVSHFIGKKTLMERMLGAVMEGKAHPLPTLVWKRINFAWSIFFIFLGTINIFVAYHFSTDAWVNFKLYGILGLLFVFSFLQALYMARFLAEEK